MFGALSVFVFLSRLAAWRSHALRVRHLGGVSHVHPAYSEHVLGSSPCSSRGLLLTLSQSVAHFMGKRPFKCPALAELSPPCEIQSYGKTPNWLVYISHQVNLDLFISRLLRVLEKKIQMLMLAPDLPKSTL